MTRTYLRSLSAVFTIALLAGCAGKTGSPTVPQAAIGSALRPAAVHAMDDDNHVSITCGTDADDCNHIRLVAPLDVAASFRGLRLSLSSTDCKHAHVRVDEDGTLPLSPATYNSMRQGPLPVSVASMTDPCDRRHGRDHDVALHPMVVVTPTPVPTTVTGNTDYYVVALIKNTDGSYTLQTLDGPAEEDGSTLSWTSPVLARSVVGTYAFYLARHRADRDDSHHGDGDDHHGDGDRD